MYYLPIKALIPMWLSLCVFGINTCISPLPQIVVSPANPTSLCVLNTWRAVHFTRYLHGRHNELTGYKRKNAMDRNF